MPRKQESQGPAEKPRITEVRVKLVPRRKAYEDRLRAFCNVTFDDSFVVRDLKVIEVQDGFFVAMPSRKLAARCPGCRTRNHFRSQYCNDCGRALEPRRVTEQNRLDFHADIAHPVNAEFRARLERIVMEAYHRELEDGRIG